MTLGKRIMENRKRLGLTQDALAEQLGVTAQAVSKWENDQSCPDIATLPKLADLFGVSVDTLLGRESQTIHTAEIIDEDKCENEGVHLNKGGWEFKWDGGRRSAMGMALFVLLVGGLLLASNLLDWGASFWDILWPSALLIFGLWGIFPKFSFFRTGCFLFGAYFLASNLNLLSFTLGKELLLPIFLLLFGLSLLADALRKPKKPSFHITHNSKGDKKSHFTKDGETFDCSLCFGENEHFVTLPRLASGNINCSFGELQIDLSGCKELAKHCRLDASCSFGELDILVPRRYRVESNACTSFGDISFRGQPDADPDGIIRLDGNVSFGEIEIRYI